MYILTIYGRETDGAYSVKNEFEEDILYIFEQEDDASRYAMMLEEEGSPEMHVIEIDDELMIKTCEMHSYSIRLLLPMIL